MGIGNRISSAKKMKLGGSSNSSKNKSENDSLPAQVNVWKYNKKGNYYANRVGTTIAVEESQDGDGKFVVWTVDGEIPSDGEVPGLDKYDTKEEAWKAAIDFMKENRGTSKQNDYGVWVNDEDIDD